MDDLAQRLLNVVADGQVATGKTVSLTALRTSVMPPPVDHQVLEAVDGVLADLDRRRMVEQHTERGGVVAYALTADGWWASTHRAKADKVVHDLLGLFRKWVQLGKADFDKIPWDVVKEAAKVTDSEIHLYLVVCHQVRLTGGWVSPVPERPGGRLVASFTRPSDFDEIVNLNDVEFLSRRQRERREERLVGRAVSSDARTVMSRAYQHLVREGEWPLTRSFNVELRKIGINLFDVATENGSLIWGTNLTDAGERTNLTLSALALVPDAEHDAVFIANIVRQLGKVYDGDPNTLDIPVLTVAAASGLSDLAILSRLVRIIGAQGAPFVVQGKPKYQLDSSTFGTGDRMLDLIATETLDDVVRVLKEQSQRHGGFVARPQDLLLSALPDVSDMPDLNEEAIPEALVSNKRGYRSTPCAVVLTALPLEYKAVWALLTDVQEVEHPKGTVYERGRFDRNGRVWDVVIAEIGQGNPRAAIEAERAIDHFEPEVAVFVGVAGGVKDVKLGDVVAATHVYGYHSGKVVEKKAKGKLKRSKAKPEKANGTEFLPRPDVGRSSYRMEQRAKAEAKKEDWKTLAEDAGNARVLVGPITAGEKVVATEKAAVAAFIKKAYSNAYAVEMEGRGFLEATHANHIDAIVVRGISDLLSKKGASDSAGWQTKAACNAAAFAMNILSRFTPPTFAALFAVDNHQDRERDLATLRRMLKHLPTTVMDFFFQQAEFDMIQDEIFRYYYDLDAEVTAGHFHFFDSELGARTKLLGEGLAKLLSFENYMVELPAGNAWRWSRPGVGDHEEWERSHEAYKEAVGTAAEAYRKLLERIKTEYKEIDLLKTTEEAILTHKKSSARRRAATE